METPLLPDNHKTLIRERKTKKKRRRRKKKTVRTLYISGLPMDVKPRELYLMFCGFEGYQGSILVTRNECAKPAPVAFISFEKREQAKIAESVLQGKQFDPDQPTTMNIEFAKEDTKTETFTQVKSSVSNALNDNCLSERLQISQTADVKSTNNDIQPTSYAVSTQAHDNNRNHDCSTLFSRHSFYTGGTSLAPDCPMHVAMMMPPFSQPYVNHGLAPYPIMAINALHY